MSNVYGDGWLNSVGRLPDPQTDPQFYVGVPARRLVAWAVDVAIAAMLTAVFVILTFGLGFFVMGLAFVAIDFTHRIIFISSRSGTIGMRLLGIELRGDDGRRFDMTRALGHTILYYIAGLSVIAQIISVIMMSGSSLGRGLHDIPLGSTMINSPE